MYDCINIGCVFFLKAQIKVYLVECFIYSKRMCILLVLHGQFCIHQLDPVDILFNSLLSLLIFSLLVSTINERGCVEVFNCNCGFTFWGQFCFVYFELLLGAYIYDC